MIWNTPDLRHRLAEVHLDDLLEAAARDRLLVQPRALRQPVSARHPRRARHRRPGTATCVKNDTSTGLLWNASGAQLGNYPDRYNIQGALSYVTGTHNIKFGGAYQWGIYPRYNNANADLYQTYNNGVPFQVTVLNTPLRVQEDLNANLGFYVQDTWNLNRLTLNYGLRFDHNKQTIVGQDVQIGRFANSPAYDDIAFPTWNDFSPRLSVVYDISGTGKTAICAPASTSS